MNCAEHEYIVCPLPFNYRTGYTQFFNEGFIKNVAGQWQTEARHNNHNYTAIFRDMN